MASIISRFKQLRLAQQQAEATEHSLGNALDRLALNPSASLAIADPSAATPVRQAVRGGATYWRRWILAAAGGAASLLAAWLITIQLDTGQLIIESPADDLKISLLQDGKVQQQARLDADLRREATDFALETLRKQQLPGLGVNLVFEHPLGAEYPDYSQLLDSDPLRIQVCAGLKLFRLDEDLRKQLDAELVNGTSFSRYEILQYLSPLSGSYISWVPASPIAAEKDLDAAVRHLAIDAILKGDAPELEVLLRFEFTTTSDDHLRHEIGSRIYEYTRKRIGPESADLNVMARSEDKATAALAIHAIRPSPLDKNLRVELLDDLTWSNAAPENGLWPRREAVIALGRWIEGELETRQNVCPSWLAQIMDESLQKLELIASDDERLAIRQAAQFVLDRLQSIMMMGGMGSGRLGSGRMGSCF